MNNTIFYSWQSDLPNATNRTFIETCLNDAIKELNKELEIQPAERDENTFSLDRDTKGIPGTPPIFTTILEKIAHCTAFVPDFTFVGHSKNGRKLPNPNVLIEYGYALSVVGHLRMIPVVNTAYDYKDLADLPFDMRHLRPPLFYKLAEGDPPDVKARVRKELVQSLHEAVSSIIKKFPKGTDVESPVFEGAGSTFSPAAYFDKEEVFSQLSEYGDPIAKLNVPKVPLSFLRLIPLRPLRMSSAEAKQMIDSGGLRPFGDGIYGWFTDRNSHGAFVCGKDKSCCIRQLTQLFHTGEIWGIEAEMLENEFSGSHGGKCSIIPSVKFEQVFVETMENYLRFARETLQLENPYRFRAGVTEVRGFRMATAGRGGQGFRGHIFDNEIVYEGKIDDPTVSSRLILIPFFNHLWESCGLKRPDKEVLD